MEANFVRMVREESDIEKPSGGFSGGSVVTNLLANAGDRGLIPGLGRFHMLGAAKPVRHNYWEPWSRNYGAPSA